MDYRASKGVRSRPRCPGGDGQRPGKRSQEPAGEVSARHGRVLLCQVVAPQAAVALVPAFEQLRRLQLGEALQLKARVDALTTGQGPTGTGLPDDLAGRLEGKSSLGRLGLLTHSTAGFIDPGFTGHITLELSTVANLPFTLWPGMKIGQLCLFRLSSPAERPYGSEGVGSRSQGQRGPTPSRAFRNFHRTDTRRI